MKSEIELLIAARALIEDPLHWCQGTSACRADGSPCNHDSPDAVCWCASGACLAMGANEGLFDTVIPWSVPFFNDTSEHADVLEMFDRAIARLL